ncbi:MAG TPA: hypothetical protein VJ898_08585 [Natrialbaceae archaeon]|nr:hypothetical protein [Natrialbaceae archaeon]
MSHDNNDRDETPDRRSPDDERREDHPSRREPQSRDDRAPPEADRPNEQQPDRPGEQRPPREPVRTGPSASDFVQAPKTIQYVKFAAVQAGIVGITFLVLTFLLDAFDTPFLTFDQGGFGAGISVSTGASLTGSTFSVIVLSLAALFGMAVVRSMPDEPTVAGYVAAAEAAAGGSAVVALLYMFAVGAVAGENFSLAFGGLILETLVLAVFAAGAAAGSAWAMQEFDPTLEPVSRTQPGPSGVYQEDPPGGR